jgi:hypothetical protein
MKNKNIANFGSESAYLLNNALKEQASWVPFFLQGQDKKNDLVYNDINMREKSQIRTTKAL